MSARGVISEGFLPFSEASTLSPIHFRIVSAAVRNPWPGDNAEPHTESITFAQNQVAFPTVASNESMMVPIHGQSHVPSDAPEHFTPQTETADARGRNDSSRRTNVTSSPVRPAVATALTSQSSTSGELVL